MPNLDNRDEAKILDQIKKLAANYVPEWKLDKENMEPGTALSMIFANMFSETIKRHNQILEKNKIVFLNMLNAGIAPAKPSTGYVTFKIAEGTKEGVPIPKGTKLVAECTDAKGNIIFETDNLMLATPTTPDCLFMTDIGAKSIFEIEKEIFDIEECKESSFKLFDSDGREDLQSFCIYFHVKDIFNIKTTAMINLKLHNCNKTGLEMFFSDSQKCEWEYAVKGEGESVSWKRFDNVMCEEDTLILIKENQIPFVSQKKQGIEGKFIRCSIKHEFNADSELLTFSWAYTSSKYYGMDIYDGMNPDKVFYNDVELKNQEFYPFGELFSVYDCFYLCCEEVLSMRGAKVSVYLQLETEVKKSDFSGENQPFLKKVFMKKNEMDMLQKSLDPVDSFIEEVIWEYWNGNGWARIDLDEIYESLFCGKVEGEKQIVFQCPMDIAIVPVNGCSNYAIRGRILKIKDNFKVNRNVFIPKIKTIRLKYEYEKDLPVENMLSYSNMEWKNCLLSPKDNHNRVVGFEKNQNQFASLYFGFEEPPEKGPIHLYFSIYQINNKPVNYKLIWEYSAESYWKPLTVKSDNTDNFKKSGSVVFYGSGDMEKRKLFGKEKYWLRVYHKGKNVEKDSIRIDGVFINTVKVLQQESVCKEIPEAIADGQDISLQLSNYPMMSEEVYINEMEDLLEKDLLKLKTDYKTDYELDEFGNYKKFFVGWKRVEDFLSSQKGDRVYCVDYASGRIILNKMLHWKALIQSPRDNVYVNYKVGGGSRGNVSPFVINKLYNSISFVEAVNNHGNTSGGSDIEKQDEVIRRETCAIKHRDRAVTVEDVEALALEASKSVGRVKCIPNRNEKLDSQKGCITIVIFPKDSFKYDGFMEALKVRVKEYIGKKTSCLLGSPNDIHVMEAAYLEISIYAKVFVDQEDVDLLVEKEMIDKLTNFLNPLEGNFEKKGWNIGEHPHVSNYYALLKSVKNVKYIESLVENMYLITKNEIKRVSYQDCDDIDYCIVRSGKHVVEVVSMGEEMDA